MNSIKQWITWKRAGFICFGILCVMFAVHFYVTYSSGWTYRAVDETSLDELRQEIKQSPFNGTLLLESARHHYRYIRSQLKNNPPGPLSDSLRRRVESALRYYRRLEVLEGWQLQSKDLFYNAYLYFQLDTHYRTRDRGSEFLDRSRDLALRAHDRGYRSPELTALLGNVHFRQQDFETALNHYQSLANSISDPLAVHGIAMSYHGLGEYQKARQILESQISSLDRQLFSGFVQQLRRDLVRVKLDSGRPLEALETAKSLVDGGGTVEDYVLLAQVHYNLGNRDRFRNLVGLLRDRGVTESELSSLIKQRSPEQNTGR